MKARNHLTTHLLIVITIAFFCFYVPSFKNFFISLFDPFKNNLLIMLIGLGLFFLGAILPDSDSFNRGSYIFYTKFAFLAYIIRILEYPLRLVTWRKKGHRQSLHTIVGIAFTSLVIAFLISFIYSLFAQSNVISDSFYLWVACLFSGQLLHLIEDKIVSPKWKIRLI